MIVKLLTEHHLEFISLKGGYICWSESKLVKMPHCWISRVAAHMKVICLTRGITLIGIGVLWLISLMCFNIRSIRASCGMLVLLTSPQRK